MFGEAIQAGDTVTLRSGGPVMTVRARSQNLAYCAWTLEGLHHQGTFEIHRLRRVPTTEGHPDQDAARERRT